MHRPEALLLIGPTGSGKSPLGMHLEETGLGGRRCAHFDFGASLRAVVEGRLRPPGLSARDVPRVAAVLASGRLLRDQEFAIAEAILADFLSRRVCLPADLVVLNGLPRHVGQAQALEPILDVRTVVHLRACARTVVERIRTNAGEDRRGRSDDSPGQVTSRLRRFEDASRPLLGYYRRRGVRIVALDVGPETRPEALRALLDR